MPVCLAKRWHVILLGSSLAVLDPCSRESAEASMFFFAFARTSRSKGPCKCRPCGPGSRATHQGTLGFEAGC